MKPAMQFLRDLPIKRKLNLITMLTSGVALLLACAAFVSYELIVFKKTMVSDHFSIAKMVGDNSSAALSFNDPASAELTLKAVSAHPHVEAAAVYDRDGKLFARYQRPGLTQGFAIPRVRQDGHEFGENHLEFFYRFSLAGENAGTVYLRSDLGAMRIRLWRYLLIVVAVILTSSLAAFLLSTKLQTVISEPISQLARVAGLVATERNYSIRAPKQSEDELGRLIDGFNEMLVQIQARDVELHDARHLLEKRVEERTGELQREITEHEHSAKALHETNQRFEVVTRATADVIWDWDLLTNALWWNENFQTAFGYPVAEIGGDLGSWKSRIFPDDQPRILKSIHGVIGSGGHLWSGEYRFRRHDGSYAFVFDRGYVLHDLQGRPVRMISAMQDFTERKRAEAELDKAHRQLLDASRQAGMAEVATGVLHNVGNVLNSVNVSATVIGDTLRRSRTANLARVVALLGEHEADLGTFITEHNQGRQIPVYLAQLSSHLATEQAGLMNEAAALQKNVGHIRDIVAMQQNYARASGVTEIVQPVEMVEDALRMNAEGLAQHQVRLVREFAAAPEITVEKHKVLQILVNLVRNAQHACDESGSNDKCLTLRVTSQDQRIRIIVSDNGVGIAPENLTRIFSHGFTTKKDGHGFGLHSAVLSAREMGGDLRVESGGPGCGATFTLELPHRPAQKLAA